MPGDDYYNSNPIHDIEDILGDKKLVPATKIWRKAFKVMIKRAKEAVAHSEELRASGEIKDGGACFELERLEVKILTYAFYHDTLNTVKTMKKYKELCSESMTDMMENPTNLRVDGVSSDDITGVYKRELLKGDSGFKIIAERMATDVEFYQNVCRALISYNAFN